MLENTSQAKKVKLRWYFVQNFAVVYECARCFAVQVAEQPAGSGNIAMAYKAPDGS
jgi:hypothetical protein